MRSTIDLINGLEDKSRAYQDDGGKDIFFRYERWQAKSLTAVGDLDRHAELMDDLSAN
jgi:hypothetical protein